MNDDTDNRSQSLVTFAAVAVVLLVVAGYLVWRYGGKGQPDAPQKAAVQQPLPAESASQPPGQARSPETVPAAPHGGRYFYAGMPRATTYTNSLTILTNMAYVVAYDEERQNPVWGCYKIFKVKNLKASELPRTFKPDERTKCRVTPGDYASSGYSLGCLGAPHYAIGLCYGIQAQDETYLMSNITPRMPPMNQGIFGNMENLEMKYYAQKYDEIWIISGNIFDTNVEKLISGVEVPDACYHIVVDEEKGKPRVLAFLVPQSATPMEQPASFLVSVRDIEQKAGFNFLPELALELGNEIESTRAAKLW